jgi:two-component system, OmpR family, KDP operon response regulator KdpE
VRAALRRASYGEAPVTTPEFSSGALRLDFAHRQVFVAGQEVHLTSTEYKLLIELAHAAGQAVPPEMLLTHIWGPNYVSDERMIPRLVYRLRQKLEPIPSMPRYILTTASQGYYLSQDLPD